MKLTDWLDALNLELEIKRFPNQQERWIVNVPHSEIKGDGVLIGTYGDANSTRGAVCNYIKKIQSQVLVLNAGSSKTRREYTVPEELTY